MADSRSVVLLCSPVSAARARSVALWAGRSGYNVTERDPHQVRQPGLRVRVAGDQQLHTARCRPTAANAREGR